MRFMLALLIALLCVQAHSQGQNSSNTSKLNPNKTRSPKLSRAELSTQMALNEVDIAPRRRWSPWSQSWFNWSTQRMDDTRDGVGRLESYNHLSVNYRLTGGTISLRPVFFVSGAGNDFKGDEAEADFEVGDIYVQYSKYNLALLPGGIGLTGAGRYYFPTSSYSKLTRSQGQLRGKFYFNKPWGAGWNSTLMVEPKYFMYTDRGYIDENSFCRCVKPNKWGELHWYFEQSHLFNANLGFSVQTGMKHKYYYDIKAENNIQPEPIRNEIDDLWITAAYGLFNIDGVMIKAGLSQERNVREPSKYEDRKRDFSLFLPEETVYSIMTFVRL